MATALAKFAEAKAAMRAAQESARVVARDAFREAAASVFATHPKLESFGWRQYTPYFNDGDECVFAAHIDEPDINGESQWDIDALREMIRTPTGEYEDVRGFGGRVEQRPKYVDVPNPTYDAALAAAASAVTDFLRAFDNGDFKELFGDHRTVLVKPDGIDIDDCEHD